MNSACPDISVCQGKAKIEAIRLKFLFWMLIKNVPHRKDMY